MNDYVLFRYRELNKNLIDSLIKGYLYFAHPGRLNDPFDCQVSIKRAVASATSRLSGTKKENLVKISSIDGYFDQIQKDTGSAGICSFSLDLENPLLWAHYAKNHQGLCLTYEFDESFVEDGANEITGAVPVEYGEDPLSDWFVENAPGAEKPDFKNFTLEIIKTILTIKSTCWSYENEFRLIRREESMLPIPKRCLTQVCFGLNMSDTDVDLVRRLIDNAGYSVSYCKIQRTASDFGIVAEEI